MAHQAAMSAGGYGNAAGWVTHSFTHSAQPLLRAPGRSAAVDRPGSGLRYTWQHHVESYQGWCSERTSSSCLFWGDRPRAPFLPGCHRGVPLHHGGVSVCRAGGAAVWTGSTLPQDSGCPVFRGRWGWTLLARVRLAGVGASLTGGHMVGPCCQPPVTESSPLRGTPSSLLILNTQAPRPGCVRWGQPSRATSPRHTPIHCPEAEVGMPSTPTMSTGP